MAELSDTDFQTTLQLMLDDLHVSRAEDIDRASTAMFKAMEFFRHQRYWFNERTYNDGLKLGVQEYPRASKPKTVAVDTNLFPFDLLRPISMQIKVGGNFYDPWEIKDIEWIREATFFTGNLGYPDFYAWHNDTIFVYSIPKESFPWRIDYVVDINRPRSRWTGTSWAHEAFIFQVGSGEFEWVPISATYTNEWLNHANEMIRNRALFTLFARHYNDREKAQDHYQAYKDEASQLRSTSVAFENETLRQRTTVL